MKMSACKEDFCDRDAKSRGMCRKHYMKWYYHNRAGDAMRKRVRDNYRRRMADPRWKAQEQSRQRQKERTKYYAWRFFVTYALLWLNGRTCALCDTKMRDDDHVEVDHKNPLSKGGSDDLSNIHLVHRLCNKRKHARRWQE